MPADAFVLLTVGLLNHNKGQVAIAGALARAARADWWWTLVGDGPDRPAVQAALRGTSLADRTVFADNSARLADWYAAADVLVSASRCETFSLVCAEALAAGLPVVLPANRPGSTLSPLAEVVTARQLGRTFERERPAGLGQVLTELADSPEARIELGARGRAYAGLHFCWDRYASCLLDLAAGISRRRSQTCRREPSTLGRSLRLRGTPKRGYRSPCWNGISRKSWATKLGAEKEET